MGKNKSLDNHQFQMHVINMDMSKKLKYKIAKGDQDNEILSLFAMFNTLSIGDLKDYFDLVKGKKIARDYIYRRIFEFKKRGYLEEHRDFRKGKGGTLLPAVFYSLRRNVYELITDFPAPKIELKKVFHDQTLFQLWIKLHKITGDLWIPESDIRFFYNTEVLSVKKEKDTGGIPDFIFSYDFETKDTDAIIEAIKSAKMWEALGLIYEYRLPSLVSTRDELNWKKRLRHIRERALDVELVYPGALNIREIVSALHGAGHKNYGEKLEKWHSKASHQIEELRRFVERIADDGILWDIERFVDYFFDFTLSYLNLSPRESWKMVRKAAGPEELLAALLDAAKKIKDIKNTYLINGWYETSRKGRSSVKKKIELLNNKIFLNLIFVPTPLEGYYSDEFLTVTMDMSPKEVKSLIEEALVQKAPFPSPWKSKETIVRKLYLLE